MEADPASGARIALVPLNPNGGAGANRARRPLPEVAEDPTA
jgi:hypothetical protein